MGKIFPRYTIEESAVKQEIEGFYSKCESLHMSVQSKLKELQQLGNFMKALKDYDLISSIAEVDTIYEYIICLEFNATHFVDFQLPVNKSTWYLDKKKIAEVRHKIRQFLKFAKDNSSNKEIKFAICKFSDKECNEFLVIRLHHNQEILPFEPPTPPGKPVESQKTESSIALTWSNPQYGAKFIDSYHIYMCKADDEKWTLCPNTNCANQTATVKSLQPNTKYLFKVHATTKIQTVVESQVSDVICTVDYELPQPKTGKKKKASSKPTKPDGETMPVKSKSSKAHNCGKEAKTAKQDTKTSPPEMHPQENPEKDFSKKSATNTYTKPDNSVIQWLYRANKCEPPNSKSTSPSIYKLNVNNLFVKQEIQLFSFVIGRRKLELPEKVILLVGATGAGKSTLINGMVNYMFGVKWEDQERVALTEISKGADQAVSQTKSVNVYKISHSKRDQLSYNLTIIDTPGFADTDGLSEDQTTMMKIEALLKADEGIIDHIDGIAFVVQASLGRLTPTQSYVINSVYSLFGRDVANNIICFSNIFRSYIITACKKCLR